MQLLPISESLSKSSDCVCMSALVIGSASETAPDLDGGASLLSMIRRVAFWAILKISLRRKRQFVYSITVGIEAF
eukprot:UN01610